jgi:hypothetical protein
VLLAMTLGVVATIVLPQIRRTRVEAFPE